MNAIILTMNFGKSLIAKKPPLIQEVVHFWLLTGTTKFMVNDEYVVICGDLVLSV